MKLIHVIHVQRFNKRHMPVQSHYVGSVRELAKQLAGQQRNRDFKTVQELLDYLRSSSKDKDFELIHSYEEKRGYEENQSAVIRSQFSG